MRFLGGVIAGLLLLEGTPAAAKEVAPEEKQPPRQVVDFNSVVLEGTLTAPELCYQAVRRRSIFKPQVKVRLDFNRELQLSTDQL